MWPGLAPVGNRRGDAHDFPKDEEPENMPVGWARSEACAEPGAND